MAAYSEIRGFLQNKDYSIANRRLLDLAYQAQENDIIDYAIALSKNYHLAISQNTNLDNWQNDAINFLAKLEKFPTALVSTQALVDATIISKKYKSSNFNLKEININLPNNFILGVVGENGNGKTTLLRCLAGQLFIENGSILYPFLGDVDCYKIKSEIAFIPQRIPKWYGLLKDNLHFSASISGIHNAQNNLMVDFMLERFNLSHYANHTWQQISSGYRTRFEIARILLQNPKLLILDEPLANLDIKAQQTLLTDLKMLTKLSGKQMGVILSSQQLHEVEKVADDVIMIRNGMQLETKKSNLSTSNVIVLELECNATIGKMQKLLGGDVKISFNGSFYTIEAENTRTVALIEKLISKVEITYFRDITNSTKRFF